MADLISSEVYLKMAYYGCFTLVSSFNTESSVTADSFMWKRMLRTANCQGRQMQMQKKNKKVLQAASGHSNELLIEGLKNGT